MRKTFNYDKDFESNSKPYDIRLDTQLGRFYVINDRILPSVTTVINHDSINKSKTDGLKRWRKSVGEDVAEYILMKASDRGTKLHKLIEEYMSGDSQSVRDVLPVGLFRNMREDIERIDNLRMMECFLFSRHIGGGIAGTVDCVADFDGAFSVIDFKTTTKRKIEKWCESYFMQTVLYSILYAEMFDKQPEKSVLIIGGEDGSTDVFTRDITKDVIEETLGKLEDFKIIDEDWEYIEEIKIQAISERNQNILESRDRDYEAKFVNNDGGLS